MTLFKTIALIGFIATCGGTVSARAAERAQRLDFKVITKDGIAIHVREVRVGTPRVREPMILLHGARVPGIASFDLPVEGGSLAEDLARETGRLVYVMDARGYGGSDRPVEMTRPPTESKPLSRAFEVVRDIDAVASAVRTRNDASTVALFGWATGGAWAGFYASLFPEHVGHLMLFNSLYGGSGPHAMLGGLADPDAPHCFDRHIGGYARYTAAQLLPVWDSSIPTDDKASWRDPKIAAAYTAAAIRSDPRAEGSPPTFRAPLGALEDSFLQATGRRLYDASTITAHVLILRSERDFWSRAEDVISFREDASRAASVQVIELKNATHMAHLDRAPHGRDQLLRSVADFLAIDEVAVPAPSRH